MSVKSLWYEIDAFLRRFLSPAVKYIFVVNTIVFLFQALVVRILILLVPSLKSPFAFLLGYYLPEIPMLSIYKFYLWQFVTYMFLHITPLHFLFNMLILFFFAPRLEWRWGSWGFIKFYFVVGVGAGIIHAIVSIIAGRASEGMIGASGALYGVLLAFALYWPEERVWVMGVVPVKMKVVIIVLGIFAFIGSIGPAVDDISHITHLGGLIVAFVYLKGPDIWRQLHGKSRPSHLQGHTFDRFSDRDIWRR